jgi:hypothetical protein
MFAIVEIGGVPEATTMSDYFLGTSGFGGGLDWSAQHSNLLAKMECGHETATSHLLLGGPAIRDLGSLARRRADEFDRTPI